MYELKMKKWPNVRREVSYTEAVNMFGREIFKTMLTGENPYVSATPIEEDEAA